MVANTKHKFHVHYLGLIVTLSGSTRLGLDTPVHLALLAIVPYVYNYGSLLFDAFLFPKQTQSTCQVSNIMSILLPFTFYLTSLM